MKEFLKYVLYFGIISLVYCVVIFCSWCLCLWTGVKLIDWFILIEVIDNSPSFYGSLVIQTASNLYGYFILNISNEIIFRLYKYDRKKNPLKNKTVLKILRFILYVIGSSILMFMLLYLFMLLNNLSYEPSFIGLPYEPVFYSLSIIIPIVIFVCILDMYRDYWKRLKKFHKIISQELSPDSQRTAGRGSDNSVL